jgi:hypothetical protein
VLGLVGVFLIQAAAANNAHASKGLDQTLRTVAHAPFGQALLLVVTYRRHVLTRTTTLKLRER